MTPDQSAALVGAAVTFAIALLGYLSLQLNQRSKTADTQHAQVLTAIAGVGTAARQAAAPAGGSGTARPYPVWNQLDDPLPTGALPLLGYDECGEECCAEVIMAQHGVPIEADALRALYRGPAGGALTTAQDLVKILGLCNVAAVVQAPSAEVLAGALQAITKESRAAIVLGTWITPGVLHWVLVTSSDSAGAQFNDPWGGVRRSSTWADVRSKYAGQLVEITRAPDPVS